MKIRTQTVELVLQTREEVEDMITAMPESDREQVSADWLARMRAAEPGDPWAFAFRVVHIETGRVVGTCGFKGPPEEGIVEIAYATQPEYEGNGYATESARALVGFASSLDEVRLIRAHTLPEAPASRRILAKCGFDYVGDTIDPEDGLVARFEKAVRANQAP